MKPLYILAASCLFVLHFILGAFFLVGWMFPEIRLIYLPLLTAWPLSWVVLGYCPITRWEFLLRKRYEPGIDPNAEFIKHYLYRFFRIDLPSKMIFNFGLMVFLMLFLASFTK